MHAAARLAHGNLGGEGDGDAVLVAQCAHNPFGNHQLVGGIFQRSGQELDFVLLIHQVVHAEIAHLAVAVLNQPAAFGNQFHRLGAEILKLAERCRGVVAALVGGHILLLLGSDDVVLQLAHHLKLHAARSLAESLAGLGQGIFRCHVEWLAVLGVEITQNVESGDVGKRVDESGAETRNHVQIAAASLQEGKQAAAVHALARSEDLVGMLHAVDDEIQRFQSPVVRHVAELDHLYFKLLDDLEDIGLGEFTHRFLKELHQTVGIEF